MKILNLSLTNYRNHKNLHLDFSERITLITGENGTGKTNIVEAIHLLSIGKSFRAHYDRDLISHEKDFARIEAQTSNDDINKLELLITKSQIREGFSSKKAKINKVIKNLAAFTDITKTVLFMPEDINIITGSPSDRRKYIDSVLFQTGIDYKRAHTVYIKALRQRNKILELISETGKGHDLIDFWTDKILENGQIIQKKRTDYFDFLKTNFKQHAENLSDENTEFDINYLKNEISEKRLEQYKEKEVFARNTLVGPHRDDFEIFIDSYDLAEFGSRGQQRTATLALKLCEIDYFSQKIEEQPVLLLDDIFSELDKNHREAVMKVINEQQTIITSTEHFDLPFEFEEVKL